MMFIQDPFENNTSFELIMLLIERYLPRIMYVA